MSEPVRLTIVINEGGLIEQIITAGVPVDVTIVNYDIEGYEGSDVATLDADGPAQISVPAVSDDPDARAFAMKAHDVARAEGFGA